MINNLQEYEDKKRQLTNQLKELEDERLKLLNAESVDFMEKSVGKYFWRYGGGNVTLFHCKGIESLKNLTLRGTFIDSQDYKIGGSSIHITTDIGVMSVDEVKRMEEISEEEFNRHKADILKYI